MSYFIAHTISFSKDFKTFKLKGGDNNVVPRCNEWTNEIPIEYLYDDLSGGMVQLKGTNEKINFINYLMSENPFGGNFNQGTDYYHQSRINPLPQNVKEFNENFISKLKDGISKLSNKPKYVIMFNNHEVYIKTLLKRGVHHTLNINNAKKFTYYRALNIIKSYSAYSTTIIHI